MAFIPDDGGVMLLTETDLETCFELFVGTGIEIEPNGLFGSSSSSSSSSGIFKSSKGFDELFRLDVVEEVVEEEVVEGVGVLGEGSLGDSSETLFGELELAEIVPENGLFSSTESALSRGIPSATSFRTVAGEPEFLFTLFGSESLFAGVLEFLFRPTVIVVPEFLFEIPSGESDDNGTS